MKKYVLVMCLCSIMMYAYGQTSTQKELIEDYNTFTTYLEETHPDPYTAFDGLIGFKKTTQKLRKQLTNQSTISDLKVLISTLTSRLQDGHTTLDLAQVEVLPNTSNSYLPVDFKVATDGLFISAASSAFQPYIGAYITAINQIPIHELLKTVRQLRSVENEYGAWDELRTLLADAHQATTLFKNPTQLALDVILPAEQKHTHLIVPYTHQPPQKIHHSSVSFQSPHPLLFSDILDKDGISVGYFAWNSMTSSELLEDVALNQAHPEYLDTNLDRVYRIIGLPRPQDDLKAIQEVPSVYATFSHLLHEMKSKDIEYLIIDLRKNRGGMTPLCRPLLYMLYGDKYLSHESKATYNRRISPLYLKKLGLHSMEQYNEQYNTAIQQGDFIFGPFGGTPSQRSIEEKRKDPALIAYFRKIGIEYTQELDGKPIHEPHVVVLTAPATFSAAYHFMYLLCEIGGATVVGCPSKQAGNAFMEVTPFELPHTHIKGSISSAVQLFYPDNPERGKVFMPDYSIHWNEYEAYQFDEHTEILYVFDLIQKQKI